MHVTSIVNGNPVTDKIIFTPQSFADLCRKISLPGCTITEINLDRDVIGSDGAKALAKALSNNKSVTTICVFEGEILDDGLEAIANVLSSNQTIKKLIVTCNKITDKGLQHLAKALEKNKTIIDINIAGNQISSEGVIALAPALKVNNTLQVLSLHNNQICSKAMHALGEALARNTGLKKIDLDRNIIDDEGLNALAQGLKGNKSITNIILSSNRITDKGVAHLVGAFGINTNINYLYLGNNSISEIGVNLLKPFFKSVEFNPTVYSSPLACHEQKPYQPPIEQPEEQPSDEAPQIPETSEISQMNPSVQVVSASEMTQQEQLVERIVPSDVSQDNPATTLVVSQTLITETNAADCEADASKGVSQITIPKPSEDITTTDANIEPSFISILRAAYDEINRINSLEDIKDKLAEQADEDVKIIFEHKMIRVPLDAKLERLQHMKEFYDIMRERSPSSMLSAKSSKKNIPTEIKEIQETEAKIVEAQQAIDASEAKIQQNRDAVRKAFDELEAHSMILYGKAYGDSENEDKEGHGSLVCRIDEAIRANEGFKTRLGEIQRIKDAAFAKRSALKDQLVDLFAKVTPGKQSLGNELVELDRVAKEWKKIGEDLEFEIKQILATLNPFNGNNLESLSSEILSLSSEELIDFITGNQKTILQAQYDDALQAFIEHKLELGITNTGEALRADPLWFSGYTADMFEFKEAA